MKSRSELEGTGFVSTIDNGRIHKIMTDLPAGQGGTDTAPTALELAVMALSGCITTIFAVVAKNSSLVFQSITVDVDAVKGDLTIEKVIANVVVKSAQSIDKVQRILDKTMKTCPVGILYEKAGVEIKLSLEVVPL